VASERGEFLSIPRSSAGSSDHISDRPMPMLHLRSEAGLPGFGETFGGVDRDRCR